MQTAMNEQQITKLIERYFAAETTLEEEKELRRLLADPSTAHIPRPTKRAP